MSDVDISGLSDDLDYAKMNGLVPAVVQHAQTGEVLMLGFMNVEAVERTIETGSVTFFSRSKSRLWTKGETSGNVLQAVSLASDCDRDTILAKALPAGPTCHQGTRTCFGDGGMLPLQFLSELGDVIAQRKSEGGEGSYTASLFAAGTRRMAQKVGEEAVEVSIAATANDREELLAESADLIYHLMVLLADKGMSLADVAGELRARHS